MGLDYVHSKGARSHLLLEFSSHRYRFHRFFRDILLVMHYGKTISCRIPPRTLREPGGGPRNLGRRRYWNVPGMLLELPVKSESRKGVAVLFPSIVSLVSIVSWSNMLHNQVCLLVLQGLLPLNASWNALWGGPGRAPKGGYSRERLAGVILPGIP